MILSGIAVMLFVLAIMFACMYIVVGLLYVFADDNEWVRKLLDFFND